MRLFIPLLALALASARAPAQAPDSLTVDSVMFSAGELYAAFSLTLPEDDAYRMTKSLTTFTMKDKGGVQIQKTRGKGLSDDILAMLALVSDTTAAKVNIIRRAGRASIPPDEEKQWMERLESMAKLARASSRAP
jgi:hypothetical protein